MVKGRNVRKKIKRQLETQTHMRAIMICPEAHPIDSTIGVEAREV